MSWQGIIVFVIVGWALYTLGKMAWPTKKSAGCASGDCACSTTNSKSTKLVR